MATKKQMQNELETLRTDNAIFRLMNQRLSGDMAELQLKHLRCESVISEVIEWLNTSPDAADPKKRVEYAKYIRKEMDK